jgi:hypothetical protein
MEMEYTVVIVPTTIRTRVLVSHGPDELLRALLPAPSQVRHERATITFLEGLSLWLDAKLRVVLCVGAREVGFCLGLTDEMGRGARSIYYEVEVRDQGARQRREQRIHGIGDFADLRQQRMAWLVPDGE